MSSTRYLYIVKEWYTLVYFVLFVVKKIENKTIEK